MNAYAGYTRVSTARQGEHGVSLIEQKSAIERHAKINGLPIAVWYEERETAAKRGRPIFDAMLKQLRDGRLQGIIMHKIDRSARNLKDWADLGELIDRGVQVHFVSDNLDMTSRGGRLSADIQAVVAADFIRNLREETRKGLYGRFKQGLYPQPAPLGYLDAGGGKPKIVDPERGPLIRQAFELYAGGGISIRELVKRMYANGLRTRRGGKVTHNVLAMVLKNPFYMGLIRYKRSGELFAGIHEPLIGKRLFDRAQQVMAGKTQSRAIKHDHTYRRRIVCRLCQRHLVAERQKGHVYYRCQTKGCLTHCLREETIDRALEEAYAGLRFSRAQRDCLIEIANAMQEESLGARERAADTLKLRLAGVDDRLGRLTDALLDRLIDQEDHTRRKASLLLERKEIEDQIRAALDNKPSPAKRLADFLELANSAQQSHKSGNAAIKRRMLDLTTSNRETDGKYLYITMSNPFHLVLRALKTCVMLPVSDHTSNLQIFSVLYEEMLKRIGWVWMGEQDKC